MSGYNTIRLFRRLEQEVDALDLCIAKSRSYYDGEDVVALIPKDENALPIYSRDVEVFVGSIEQLELWLKGVEWARNYDQLLKVSDDKKRARKEQDVRNRNLVRRLASEELKDDTDQNW